MKTFAQLKILENFHVSRQLGQVVQDNGLGKHRPEVNDRGLGRIQDFKEGDSRYCSRVRDYPSRKSYFFKLRFSGILRPSQLVIMSHFFLRPNPITIPFPTPPQDPPQPEYFKPLEPVLVYRDHRYYFTEVNITS